MKKILLAFFVPLLFPAFIFCGRLVVDQMGTGWLYPDELVDMDYNPARVNSLSVNSLDVQLSDFASFNRWETTNGYIETYPVISYSGNFGGVNGSLAYGGESIVRSRSYNYYTNYLNAVAGSKITRELSWGVCLSFFQYDYRDTFHKIFDSDKSISAGLDYSNDGSIYGLSMTYKTQHAVSDDYFAAVSLLYGVKLGEKGSLRGLNTLSYLSAAQYIDPALIDINSLPATSTLKRFGKLTGVNRTAVSYTDFIGFVRYSAGITNDWTFKDYSNTIEGVTADFKRYEYTATPWADLAVITLGIEMPLFAEWLRLRLKYEPARYSRFYRQETFERQTGFDYNHWDYSHLEVLPARLASIGLGIDAGKGLKIDVTFGWASLYYLAHFENESAYKNDHTTCLNIEALWSF